MAIVCDTSPLSYLVLIGEVDILADLYGHVSIPSAVADELQHPDGPDATRRWINAPPEWLHVAPPYPRAPSDTLLAENEAFSILDRGERAAIRLAMHEDARLLVIDERAGRAVANDLGLAVTGTLGVLDVAAAEGLVDVAKVIERLRATSFRAAPSLYRWLLSRHER